MILLLLDCIPSGMHHRLQSTPYPVVNSPRYSPRLRSLRIGLMTNGWNVGERGGTWRTWGNVEERGERGERGYKITGHVITQDITLKMHSKHTSNVIYNDMEIHQLSTDYPQAYTRRFHEIFASCSPDVHNFRKDYSPEFPSR